MTEPEYQWCDVDFRPAPFAGWRAVFLDDTQRGKTHLKPVAGWLVQHLYPVDPHSGKPRAGDLPQDRRVVPAVHDDGTLVQPQGDDFFGVLGPGENDPTLDAVSKAWDARRAAA